MMQEEFLLHGATAEHRRLRRAGRAERADPARDRRQRHLQCAGQQRSRDRRDRPRDPALPDQPDGRAAGRASTARRSAIPASSATASPRTRRTRPGSRSPSSAACRSERVGGHGDGGGRAAPDHERVDDQARGDPGDLRRRDARQPAALLDPSRQLRDRSFPSSCASTCRRRSWSKTRHRRASSTSARASIAANGPRSARAPWCATAATASIRRWNRPTSCW